LADDHFLVLVAGAGPSRQYRRLGSSLHGASNDFRNAYELMRSNKMW
jgi:hypothetical protein